MKILSRIIVPAAIAATALTLTACNDSDDSGISSTINTTIVTYDGRDTSGDLIFTHTISAADGTDTFVKLHGVAKLTENIPLGTRLVLTYRYLDGLKYPASGAVGIIGASKAATAPVTSIAGAPELSSLSPIYVEVLERAGNYINLWCELPQSQKRTFAIELDATTAGSDQPTLYITTALPEGESGGYVTTYGTSFDVSDVWNNPATRSMVVKVNNSNNPNYTTFTFNK